MCRVAFDLPYCFSKIAPFLGMREKGFLHTGADVGVCGLIDEWNNLQVNKDNCLSSFSFGEVAKRTPTPSRRMAWRRRLAAD